MVGIKVSVHTCAVRSRVQLLHWRSRQDRSSAYSETDGVEARCVTGPVQRRRELGRLECSFRECCGGERMGRSGEAPVAQGPPGGRAQKAFQRLPAETQANFDLSWKALKERFEPASKKELYMAELQTRTKQPNERWPDLAEDLRTLADKAYPDLEDAAREQIALTSYLGQLSKPQVAFSVKQQKPTDLEEAVHATLEIESYLRPGARVAQVAVDDSDEPVGAVGQPSQDTRAIMELLRQVTDRLERLESGAGSQRTRTSSSQQKETARPRDPASSWSRNSQPVPVVCRRCGKEGHYARGCATRRPSVPLSGNGMPPAPGAGRWEADL